MNDSILTSIKKLLGLTADDTAFDTDIIIHINTVFGILYQLGVGTEYFSISDATTTWAAYLPTDKSLEDIKTYIYLKVKMIFDPPQSSAMEAYKQLIDELEFRINITADRWGAE